MFIIFVDDINRWVAQNPEVNTAANYPGLIPNVTSHLQDIVYEVNNEIDQTKLDVSVTIVQGDKDSVVPYQLNQWLVGNMTAAGTDVTYVVIKGGAHGTGIRERVDEYIAFIQQYLPSYPPAAETPVEEEFNGPFYIDEVPYTLATLSGAANGTVMTYKMPNVRGEIVNATALVWYPTAPMPVDGYRVMVWDHGTIGAADACVSSSRGTAKMFLT